MIKTRAVKKEPARRPRRNEWSEEKCDGEEENEDEEEEAEEEEESDRLKAAAAIFFNGVGMSSMSSISSSPPPQTLAENFLSLPPVSPLSAVTVKAAAFELVAVLSLVREDWRAREEREGE